MKPLFVDLQVNGHGGIDLLSAKSVEDVRKVSRSLFQNEVLGYVTTLITSSLEVSLRAIELIEEVRINPLPGEAIILGTHLEGPFISLEKRGVHPPEFVKNPDLLHMKALLSAGLIKQVTLAPELPGAIELVKFLVGEGVLVSLGHSNATKAEAIAGFQAGAKSVTHLFNAMPKPPQIGLADAALQQSNIAIQIIIDGVHVSDNLLKETLPKIIGRFIVTNDAVAAAGLGEGTFPFGGMELTVTKGEARRTDGTLAGGVANLRSSLAKLEELEISPEIALASVTTRPCDLIGVSYNSLYNLFDGLNSTPVIP